MSLSPNAPIPETHEKIRDDDIAETLDIFESGNDILSVLTPEQHDWLKMALTERKYLCANQFNDTGAIDSAINSRLLELDGMINSVNGDILRVLHFLSRIRAILPILMELKQKIKQETPDPNEKMILNMQYECSMAEVKSAIEGLAALRVRPRILEQMEG